MGGGDILELIGLLEGHSRLSMSVALKNKTGHEATIMCVIDTGCATTMLDMTLAKRYGVKLPETTFINIANKRYAAQAYRLHKLLIGNLELDNVFVLGVDYEIDAELRSGMLLGLNVLNNLMYCVDRNKNAISVKENIFDAIPDKNYPYLHWFRIDENNEKVYVKLQG